MLTQAKYDYFSLDEVSLGIAQMRDQKICEGDLINVLGYPMQIVGTKKKEYPLIRSGSIAQLQPLLDREWGTFFIDAFVFPGNSGGPVILRQENMYVNESKPIKEPRLIGVVSGYLPYKESLVNQQTQEVQTILTVNPGLSHVWPVDYIVHGIEAAERKH